MNLNEEQRHEFIEKFKNSILYGLPEWNYTGADKNPDIAVEQEKFVKHMDEFAEVNLTSVNDIFTGIKRIVKNDVPDSHINVLGMPKGNPDTNPEYRTFWEKVTGEGAVYDKSFPEYDNFAEKQDLISTHEKKDFKTFPMPTYDGEEIPVLVGTHQKDGKNIGIIAAPSMKWKLPSDVKEQSDAVRAEIKRQMKENNWDSICFDLRGNPGGEKHLFSDIVDDLAGQKVPWASSIECLALKPEASIETKKVALDQLKFSCNFPPEAFPTVEMAGIAKRIAKDGFTDENLTDLKKEWDKYPAAKTFECDEEKMAFKGKIAVLTDRNNCSSAEGAIYKLSQLPRTTIVGDNTQGCYQGAYCAAMDMGHGAVLSMGIAYQTREKNGQLVREGYGQTPDVKTDPRSAYETTLDVVLSAPDLNKKLGMKKEQGNNVPPIKADFIAAIKDQNKQGGSAVRSLFPTKGSEK